MLLVPFFDNMPEAMQRARFTADGILEVRTGESRALWHHAPYLATLAQTLLCSQQSAQKAAGQVSGKRQRRPESVRLGGTARQGRFASVAQVLSSPHGQAKLRRHTLDCR